MRAVLLVDLQGWRQHVRRRETAKAAVIRYGCVAILIRIFQCSSGDLNCCADLFEDGGGVRGLSSLIILQHLMRTINLAHPPKPCDYFDLIGGTSTGGLIAIMLGRLKMDIEECITAYLEISRDVFQPKKRKYDIFGRASDALKVRGRFDSEALKRGIQKIVVQAGEDENAKLKIEDEPKCRV